MISPLDSCKLSRIDRKTKRRKVRHQLGFKLVYVLLELATKPISRVFVADYQVHVLVVNIEVLHALAGLSNAI